MLLRSLLLCCLAFAACYEDPGDLYDLLGVSPQANSQEVKKAYRTLSLIHHPGGFCEHSLKLRQPSPPSPFLPDP